MEIRGAWLMPKAHTFIAALLLPYRNHLYFSYYIKELSFYRKFNNKKVAYVLLIRFATHVIASFKRKSPLAGVI